MKVIDLLNKIANGEEVPKKIKYRGIIWYLEQGFSNRLPYYKNGYNTDDLLTGRERDYFSHSLNDEVEIIEDTPKEDKKIEHIHLANVPEDRRWFTFRDKINEIIDRLNGE